jgi:hypothetical protein
MSGLSLLQSKAKGPGDAGAVRFFVPHVDDVLEAKSAKD